MKASGYLVLMILALVVSWLLWGAILVFIDPEELGAVGVALFLITFGAAVFTSCLLVLYYLRIKFLKLEPIFRQFNIIFRESFLVSLLVVISLLLARFNWMNFFYFLLMLLLVMVVDICFILTYDKRRYKKIK